MTRLIVSADDYGLSKNASNVILETIERGVVTSVSLLANAEAAAYAVAALRERAPATRLAVHLNLTEGRALSGAGPLTDADGAFRFSVGGLLIAYYFSSRAARGSLRMQVRREFSAQLARVRSLSGMEGPLPVDGHQHVHILPFACDELLEIAGIGFMRIPDEPFFIAPGQFFSHFGKNGLARPILSLLSRRAARRARAHGIATNDSFIGFVSSGKMTYEIAAAGLQAAGGSVELCFHPGALAPHEPLWERGSRDWYGSSWRDRERRLLLDTRFRASLEKATAMPKPDMSGITVRYVISGTAAATTTFGLLYALTEWAGWWYVISATLAFASSIAVSFLLQRYWTFRDRHPIARTEVLWFMLLNAGNIVANAAGLYALVELGGVHYLAAEFVVALVIAVWSFAFMRLLFRTGS